MLPFITNVMNLSCLVISNDAKFLLMVLRSNWSLSMNAYKKNKPPNGNFNLRSPQLMCCSDRKIHSEPANSSDYCKHCCYSHTPYTFYSHPVDLKATFPGRHVGVGTSLSVRFPTSSAKRSPISHTTILNTLFASETLCCRPARRHDLCLESKTTMTLNSKA